MRAATFDPDEVADRLVPLLLNRVVLDTPQAGCRRGCRTAPEVALPPIRPAELLDTSARPRRMGKKDGNIQKEARMSTTKQKTAARKEPPQGAAPSTIGSG